MGCSSCSRKKNSKSKPKQRKISTNTKVILKKK